MSGPFRLQVWVKTQSQSTSAANHHCARPRDLASLCSCLQLAFTIMYNTNGNPKLLHLGLDVALALDLRSAAGWGCRVAVDLGCHVVVGLGCGWAFGCGFAVR